MVSSNPVSLLFVCEPIGHTVGMEALIADITRDVQPFRPLFGLETIAFLRIVERFEVDYYNAFTFVG